MGEVDEMHTPQSGPPIEIVFETGKRGFHTELAPVEQERSPTDRPR